MLSIVYFLHACSTRNCLINLVNSQRKISENLKSEETSSPPIFIAGGGDPTKTNTEEDDDDDGVPGMYAYHIVPSFNDP